MRFQERVETGPIFASLDTANPRVLVNLGDLPSAPGRFGIEGLALVGGALIVSRDAKIERGALQLDHMALLSAPADMGRQHTEYRSLLYGCRCDSNAR